jgi:glucose/arabinose dehydrogenase
MKKAMVIWFMLMGWMTKAQPIIELRPFTSQSIGQVVGIISSGDDRLFAVVQSGIIRLVRKDGTVDPTPFMDIRSQVQSGGERGLLGLAFSPDYPNDPTFYLNYTRPGNATVISRWRVSEENPDLGDLQSEEILLVIEQPFANHNGGDIRFGPDGFLYIGMGDGGSGNDPQNLSQNPLSYHGKILRLDVSVGESYRIPQDNPFLMDSNTLDEIWALGLRNPWRFSFDKSTGDLWIADVGQNAVEEINKQPFESQGGENYGWRCYEGTRPNITNGCDEASAYTFPIYEYDHSQGDRSITGGFVYRGLKYPAMQGHYIFSDFVSSRFFSIKETDSVLLTDNMGVLGVPSPSTFGEDSEGELYVASYFSGTLHRVVDFCQAYFPMLQLDTLNNRLQVELEEAEWGDDLSIEWFNDGVLMPDQKEDFLVLEGEGFYSARVTHSKGCVFDTDTLRIQTTAIHKWEWPTEIKVGPNPFSNEIMVYSDYPVPIQFEIIDLRGNVVFKTQINSLDQRNLVLDLPSAVYFCRVRTEQGKYYMKKLIKQ